MRYPRVARRVLHERLQLAPCLGGCAGAKESLAEHEPTREALRLGRIARAEHREHLSRERPLSVGARRCPHVRDGGGGGGVSGIPGREAEGQLASIAPALLLGGDGLHPEQQGGRDARVIGA